MMDGATATRTACPFPGLRPFWREEAPMFFGRSRDIAELRRALLGERRFVAVVGSSGCGKSSLVEAGLLPRLLGEQPPAGRPWRDIPLRPQRAPVAQLAAALARLAREEQPDSFGRLHTANARQPVPRHAAADHNRVGRGGPRDPPGPGDPGAGLRGPVRGAVPLRAGRDRGDLPLFRDEAQVFANLLLEATRAGEPKIS